MTGKLAFLKDGTEDLIQTIADYIAKGFTLDDLNTWRAKIEAVTVDDIKAAAQLIFKKEADVTLEIYPEPTITA